MRVTGTTANLPVADIAAASEFYREYLGLSVEAMNLGWVARYASADGRAWVQLVTGEASAPQDSVISVHVGPDVAYDEARRRGYEIVHPLTDEPWGVRRFFVRGPRWQHHQHRQSFRRVRHSALLRLQRRHLPPRIDGET
jgi:catechol 2,3-dioxygenase-like lactoylglutathione lyase family enzyme